MTTIPVFKQLSVKLACALGLVALADIFFFGHPVGWTVAAYAAVLWVVVMFTQGRSGCSKQAAALAILLAGLLFAMFAQPALLPLLLFVLGLWTYVFLPRRADMPAHVWLSDMLRAFLGVLQAGGRERALLAKLKTRKRGARKIAGPVLGYILLPVMLAALFVYFFAQANPVLEKWLAQFDWSVLFDLLSPLRWVFWIAVFAAVWVLVRPPVRGKAKLVTITAAPAAPGYWFSRTSVVVSLVLFNLIFALQNGMDAMILWQQGNALPEGVSYAAYAQRGAYPLILTVLVAAGYVLLVFDQRRAELQSRAARVLTFIWLAQNVFLLASAASRNMHYIDAYSLTYLRLSAMIWMGLIAVGLWLIVWRIARDKTNDWLVGANILSLLAVLYACCFVNFGGFIADYNVRRSHEMTGSGRHLDLIYMRSLGAEALPALRHFTAQATLSPAWKAQVDLTRKDMERALESELQSDWRAWTWRKARLAEGIEKPAVPGAVRTD